VQGARLALAAGAGLSWPSRIDRQRRVGRDLDVRTVVVAIVSVAIETVLPHPLDDLQNALRRMSAS
jgi:hypothetical protein